MGNTESCCSVKSTKARHLAKEGTIVDKPAADTSSSIAGGMSAAEATLPNNRIAGLDKSGSAAELVDPIELDHASAATEPHPNETVASDPSERDSRLPSAGAQGQEPESTHQLQDRDEPARLGIAEEKTFTGDIETPPGPLMSHQQITNNSASDVQPPLADTFDMAPQSTLEPQDEDEQDQTMATSAADGQPPVHAQALQSTPQTQGAKAEPVALGLRPEASAKITPRGSSVRDVAITSEEKDGSEKAYVLASDIEKGLRQYEIFSGKSGALKLPPWQYASSEKGSVRMKKGGIVSSVCTLADGRVAVSIIDRRRVLVLRWSSAPASGDGLITSTAGSWSVVQKVKLRCDPYRIDALGSDTLAVAGTEAQQKPTSFLGSSSKWGPGPHVSLAYLTSRQVKLVQCGELKFKAVAISLADGLLIAASSDAVADEGGKLWSYVVEAYDLPKRPDDKSGNSPGQILPPALKWKWTSPFDEQVQDVCALPCKVAVYVVLPDSRRVAGVHLRTGEWLVDVLDCGSGRPIRIDIAPRSQQATTDGEGSDVKSKGTMKAAVLYADSSVSVHSVGVFD